MVGKTTRQFWFDRLAAIVRSSEAAEVVAFFAPLDTTPLATSTPVEVYRGLALRLKRLPLERIETLLDEAERHFSVTPLRQRVCLDWRRLRR